MTLVAFDLIELQADDLRDLPLEQRKQRLAKLLARGGGAITYNEHLEPLAEILSDLGTKPWSPRLG